MDDKSGFFEYEKSQNTFLQALQRNLQFKDVLDLLQEEGLALFVPQSVTIENVKISRDFVETHVVYFNPTQLNTSDIVQWISLVSHI